ncbi:MAG TPA: GNAT family N-acetyltransferase [Anaerolineales bacterium]
MTDPTIRMLETPEDLSAAEGLQRDVWPGSETDIVPAHMLIAAVHNGGVVLGAFEDERLVGFVFGFPGLESTPDGPRPKHCSHMAAVLPSHRDRGLGFALKRAQWQVVRHQGLDHITWTYDLLLSRNAHLNISRLGAVCSTYLRSEYGEMRDALNAGLPSDRFQVDWWLNTHRVERRLSKRARPLLTPAALTRMGVQPLYDIRSDARGLPLPPERIPALQDQLLAAEIPADFMAVRTADLEVARAWRFFAREFFESAFALGYIVTDFAFDKEGDRPRGLYVLTDGESTLESER